MVPRTQETISRIDLSPPFSFGGCFGSVTFVVSGKPFNHWGSILGGRKPLEKNHQPRSLSEPSLPPAACPLAGRVASALEGWWEEHLDAVG